jgi:hypothetical protein
VPEIFPVQVFCNGEIFWLVGFYYAENCPPVPMQKRNLLPLAVPKRAFHVCVIHAES